MKFKAAMFDFDGTITEKGVYSPTQEMADALVKLAQKMPIGFCTGRQLESFELRGLAVLLDEIDLKDRRPFLENLFLFGENGSIGYDFNPKTDNFREFYRVAWPDSFVDRGFLQKKLAAAVKEYGELYHGAHRVVVVIRTKLHSTESRNIKDVYYLSDRIYEACVDTLKQIDPNFEKYLHVGNSGIGVVICPADGDKDTGIKKFAEFLAVSRGIRFGDKLREILVVGDRPRINGNDYYFLNGNYGTPYTVGDLPEEDGFPKPVINESGQRLLHAEGTLCLIKNCY